MFVCISKTHYVHICLCVYEGMWCVCACAQERSDTHACTHTYERTIWCTRVCLCIEDVMYIFICLYTRHTWYTYLFACTREDPHDVLMFVCMWKIQLMYMYVCVQIEDMWSIDTLMIRHMQCVYMFIHTWETHILMFVYMWCASMFVCMWKHLERIHQEVLRDHF